MKFRFLPTEVTKNVLFRFLCMREIAMLSIAYKPLYAPYIQQLKSHQNKIHRIPRHVNKKRQSNNFLPGVCFCSGGSCYCGNPMRFVQRIPLSSDRNAGFTFDYYSCRCHDGGGILRLSHPEYQVLETIPLELSEYDSFLRLLEIIKSMLRIPTSLITETVYVNKVTSWLKFIGLLHFFPDPKVREIRYPRRKRKQTSR